MPLMLFDFECEVCTQVFEELVDRDNPDPVKCPTCASSKTKRLITGTRIDPKLGIDAAAFPTMGDKWARVRRQHKAIETKRRLAHGDAD